MSDLTAEEEKELLKFLCCGTQCEHEELCHRWDFKSEAERIKLWLEYSWNVLMA